MKRAILFELDDVLFDPDEFARAALRPLAESLAERYSRDRSHYLAGLLATWRESTGRDLCFLEAFVQSVGLPSAEACALADKLARRDVTIPLFPDATRILAQVSRDFALGIVTDGSGLLQRSKVRGLDLVHRFTSIVFSSDWGSVWQRPSPLPLQVALREMRMSASETVFVGCDPDLDAAGPCRLQMSAVRLRRGAHRDKPDRFGGFCAEIDTLDALLDLDLFRDSQSA